MTYKLGSATFVNYDHAKSIIQDAFPFDQKDGTWKCPYCRHTYRWAQTHIWKIHVRIEETIEGTTIE